MIYILFGGYILEGAIVFIDDAYLSLISKHFGGGKHLKYDLNQLAITLAKSQGMWCKKVYWYDAPPYQSPKPTDDEKERKRKYDKFISKLRNIPNFIIREGRCQKINDEYHQKGVDTLFTMDLLEEARKREVNTFVIVTCDTDFVPILNKIRELGIEIILFYYSDFVRHSRFSMSNHILTACDKCILIRKDHFDRSVKNKKIEDFTTQDENSPEHFE